MNLDPHALCGAESTPDLVFRPVVPSDADTLQRGFAELSPRARYYRFHAVMPKLSRPLLRKLTHVDGVDHVASLALERHGDSPPSPVGVVRFERTGPNSDMAELAVTVLERAQGRGIGRRPLREAALVAQARGISSFLLLVLDANVRVRAWMKSLHAEQQGASSAGVIAFVIPGSRLADSAQQG